MPYYGGTPMAADPKFLMQRLMQRGMSRMQAAAIVGNLQRESGLASNNMNKDEGAYGLMQWRGPRFEALQQFAAAQKVPWTDPGAQADFIAHEMQTTERKNAAPFMAATSIDEASAALKPVIRYGDKSGPERAMHARNFFGAADAAPETTAAPLPARPPGQPPVAQPAVSRETLPYATTADRRSARPIRAGMESLGEGLSAQLEGRARMPPGLTRLGNALSGVAQQMGAMPPSNLPADPRAEIATQVAGSPPAAAPPGAPEPPRFPGGVPLPRARPLTGPGMMQGDPLDPMRTVAELGSIVDPMRYDYG